MAEKEGRGEVACQFALVMFLWKMFLSHLQSTSLPRTAVSHAVLLIQPDSDYERKDECIEGACKM